jgi:hypothetical protein
MTTARLDRQSARRRGRPSVDRPRQTIVAIEAVLLWPRRSGKQAVSNAGPGLWPILAVVLGDENASTDPSVRTLYDLLGRRRTAGQVTVLKGRCLWSVVWEQDTLLRLAVRTSAPTRFEVDIMLPARPLLDAVGSLTRGGTVALTTRQHASQLNAGVNVGDALHGLVLVNCPQLPELAALARAQAETDQYRQLVH